MGEGQYLTAGLSKTGKSHRFRFSRAGKTFLKDYFHNTSKAPKKKERQQILAHLKELGDTETTSARITNWFVYNRQKERKRPSLQLSTSVPESNETKWVDARHKSLWPSLTTGTLKSLAELYAEHVARCDATDPPYDLWAEGLDANPAHVHMWCKFEARESTRHSQSDATPIATTSFQMPEEHSQLPTPGTSTSPEPRATFTASPPLSPDAIKYEPPATPVVETAQFQPQFEGPKGKSSMGLHEAIESAFSAPLYPPAPSIQPPEPPSPATRTDQQRKPSSRNTCRTIDVIPPPTPLSISANTTTALAPASSPPTSITSPPPKPPRSPSPPLSHHEPSDLPSSEEPIPGPSTQPDRDIARERADLVTGVAGKLDELGVIFSSTHGLSQLAGSIECISQRNQQFLNDVSAGRFAHMRLTSAHLPNPQMPSPMPEFDPQRILTRRDSKGKGKEREKEDEMDVD